MNEEKNNEVMVFNPEIRPIEEKQLDQVISDAEEIVLYAKPLETEEFQVGEAIEKFLIGTVTGIDRYGGKWEDGDLKKIRNIAEKDLPEDYELRGDVRIISLDYRNIVISLPPSSYKYHFAPFLKQRKAQGIKIDNAVLIFTVKLVRSKKGKNFPVVITKMYNPGEPVKVNDDDNSSGGDDSRDDADIPF